MLNAEVFDFKSALADLNAFFSEFARQKQINFEMTIGESVPKSIKADKTRLMQIAINLTSNALKFSPIGKSVSIEIDTQTECCGNLAKDIAANQPHLVIRVRDQAIGISEENIAKLFKPFFQVHKNSTQGSGLGLYICHELASLMHGHICCQSELGVGSTFTFVSPCESVQLAEQANEAESTVIDEQVDAVIASQRILVAEDNKVNQLVIANMLKKIGCAFDIVENGELACNQFNEAEYFLVLMDMMMPVMDGYEATHRISESNQFKVKKPMIVALTASVTEQEVNAAREAGCVDVLSKPINLARLRETISSAARKQAVRKSPRFALGRQRPVPILHLN